MMYGFTFLFMVLDFITGIVKAFSKHEFTSCIMREGLVHKSGSILCVALGTLCEYGNKFLDLGIDIPIASAICCYVSLMEIGSIIENLGTINPKIVPSKLKSFFTKLGEI